MTAEESEAKCLNRSPDEASSAGPAAIAAESVADRSQALAEIARTHHSALMRFLVIRTGSKEDAKELLQEAYAKLLALDRPGTISLLAGYLWRIAVNLSIDRGRKQALHQRFTRTASLQFAKNQELSAESIAESRERLAIVERAIGELPARCQEAFILHVLKGLTFAEVGREMGISSRMAQKHLARALEYLQFCADGADRTGRAW
jgi:RNA polymerase sigma factor (sigma-70 family)